MPGRTRPAYPPEYKRRLVELVRQGRTREELSTEFEPTPTTIRTWVRQADLDDGRRKDGLTTSEREELQRLRREIRLLKEEKEILKKAAAWFAKESTSTRKSGSDS